MNFFLRYREIVQEGINELQENIQPPSLKEQINYFLSLGGKRLRPSLVLAGCDLFNGNIADAKNAAIGIELFHNFTLLHDDIMDEAPLRRNKETVHTKWNISTAILAGDAMYAGAFHQIIKVNAKLLPEILNLFCTTATEVCEGQQLDMLFESKNDVSVTDYLHMIEMKTAVLLACALKIGAIIAGASEKDKAFLYAFGQNIGIAFQLQDDLLDVYGEQEKFGKKPGGDIVSGKKTFLLLKALEGADEKQKEILIRKSGREKEVNNITTIYDQLDIKSKVRQQIDIYYHKALTFLEKIEADDSKKEILSDFASGMMIREF